MDMLKILIVDDEFYFRQALKIKIPWEELGFVICAEARNGQEALEKIAVYSPDILLVDINMPIMDGLELVEKLHENGSSIKIIILSGYGEFGYAKHAISFGVHNYLLKPLNTEELKNEVLKLKKIIEAEQKIKQELGSLKRQLKENIPVLREKLLNDLLQGAFTFGAENVLKRMDYLNLNSIKASDRFGVIAVTVDAVACGEQDRYLRSFAVRNVAEEMLTLCFEREACFDSEGRVCFLLGCEEDSNGFDPAANTVEVCERIREFVKEQLGFTVSIGVGCFYKDIFSIAASYNEAVLALKNRLTLGCDIVISYSSVSEKSLDISLFNLNERSMLLMNMRACDPGQVALQVERLFEMARQRNLRQELIISMCIELVSTCFEYTTEVGLNFSDIYGSLPEVFYKMQEKSSIHELKDWIRAMFTSAVGLNSNGKSNRNRKIIAEIKDYLEENYSDFEFNGESLSKKMFMNYCYMSNIFRKETGVTINEYLTGLKIKKAKELMDGGCSLVNEVAEKIGYEDPNYFSRCFKKAYGVTPSKYIEGLRK
jgi:two-component system response regulator YesN